MIAIYVIGGLLVYVVGALITGWLVNIFKPEDRTAYMTFWPIMLPVVVIVGSVLCVHDLVMEPLAARLFDKKGGEG